MLHSVIRATPRWFDTTPTGRIVNRFSRDQETIDGQLSGSLRVVATWTAALIGAIIMVAIIVPSFLIRKPRLVSSRFHQLNADFLLTPTAALFISYAYLRLSSAYIRVGRDLRRSSFLYSSFALSASPPRRLPSLTPTS